MDKLKQAFTAALGIPGTIPLDTLDYRSIPQWDSVAHMQLVMEIENAFDVMLDTDDVIGLSSFTKASEILSRHGIDIAA